MKRILFFAVTLFSVLAITITFFIHKKKSWQKHCTFQYSVLPSIDIFNKGESYSLSSFNHGFTFVRFYSNSCILCTSEIKELVPCFENNTDFKFVFIDINIKQNKPLNLTDKDTPYLPNVFFANSNNEINTHFEIGKNNTVLYIYKNGKFLLRVKGYYTVLPMVERLKKYE